MADGPSGRDRAGGGNRARDGGRPPVGDGTLSDRAYGDVIAVGIRPAGGGRIALAEAPRPHEPTLRFQSRARTIEDIEKQLTRIWASTDLTAPMEGAPGRHVAARTSVMNLVIIARTAEVAERCAATVSRLTGRHPSRTLAVQSADPDGPSWIDARIQAYCVLPRQDAPETCAELIFLTAGGEAGRHLAALVTPLLIHDLPVMLWWPGEPHLASRPAEELLESADRLVVDGSTWSGDGLDRVRALADLYHRFPRLSIRDFALVRQSRWREAIAAVFDMPEFLPYLPYLRRVSVTYGTHDATGAPGSTNVIKPLYHVAWLGSRLGLRVVRPLRPSEARSPAVRRQARCAAGGAPVVMHRGLVATFGGPHGEVAVVVRPVESRMPSGTTLRVELLAERRGSELRADVTAEAENVHVRVWLDGVEALERTFKAPRRTDVDLLDEAIEIGGRDPIAVETIRMAAALAARGNGGRGK